MDLLFPTIERFRSKLLKFLISVCSTFLTNSLSLSLSLDFICIIAILERESRCSAERFDHFVLKLKRDYGAASRISRFPEFWACFTLLRWDSSVTAVNAGTGVVRASPAPSVKYKFSWDESRCNVITRDEGKRLKLARHAITITRTIHYFIL